jgi:hypothetical protein
VTVCIDPTASANSTMSADPTALINPTTLIKQSNCYDLIILPHLPQKNVEGGAKLLLMNDLDD